jgi:hypothetical protein
MLENLARMIGNELDSVKHIIRGIQWRTDAIIKHLNVNVQPDALEPIVNPPPTFINKIITEARGDFVGAQSKMPRRKPKRSQRRRRVIPKRDFRRKKK